MLLEGYQIKDYICEDPEVADAVDSLIKRTLNYLDCGYLIAEIDKIRETYSGKTALVKIDHLIIDKIGNLLSAGVFGPLYGTATKYKNSISVGDIIANLEQAPYCDIVQNIVGPNSPIVYPNNFNGTLYLPQAAMLYRIKQLELRPNTELFGRIYNLCMGIISAQIGFGKTYLASAMIADNPNFDLQHYNSLDTEAGLYQKGKTLNSNIYDVNIVLCNLKTTKEWEQNLKNLTNLSVFKITSEKMLNTFQSMLTNNEKLPNVLLVKDGKIRGRVLIEIISELLGNNIINRLIVDDYDMLNLDKNIVLPSAKFYWFISSTRNFGNNKASKYAKTGNTTAGSDTLTVSCIEKAMIAFDLLCNIKCLPSFVSPTIPRIDFYKFPLRDDSIMHSVIEDFILQNTNYSTSPYPNYFNNLLLGNVDVPYTSDSKIKALVLSDTDLSFTKLSSMNISSTNIDEFQTNDIQVGLAKPLTGINMPYITHVIVNNSYNEEQIVQFIGRAQRCSRTHNLQVLFIDLDGIEDE